MNDKRCSIFDGESILKTMRNSMLRADMCRPNIIRILDNRIQVYERNSTPDCLLLIRKARRLFGMPFITEPDNTELRDSVVFQRANMICEIDEYLEGLRNINL